MKFLFASAAAALMASSFGASAADLAKKAPVAVDYVKVCDAYGAGFFYIPGTDTCLKIGGYVRVQAYGGSDDYGNYDSGDSRDSYTSYARLQLQIDARSQSEYGVVRSFAAVNTQYTSGNTATSALDKAYVQFAGFTAGYATSMWDFFTGTTMQIKYGSEEHDESRNLLAYTFGFGNGLTGTISVEDASMYGRTSTIWSSGASTSLYGGNKAPDIVANLNLTQGWGSAQVMGVAHQLQGTDGIGDQGWGWAAGAGVKLNLPMIGAGDVLALQAVYGDGALIYVSEGATAITNKYEQISVTDFNANGDTTTAWSIEGGFTHNFTPNWQLNLDAAYLDVDQAAGYTDFNQWDVAAALVWKPANNLAVTGTVEYRSTSTDDYGDQDGVLYGMRVQRNF